MAPKRRILIAEDGPTKWAKTLRFVLELEKESEGYQVQTASNSRVASAKIRQHRPQLMIADLNLLNKESLSEALEQHRGAICVIGMSYPSADLRSVRDAFVKQQIVDFVGGSDASNKQQIVNFDGDSFIDKARFDPNLLIEQVKKAFEEKVKINFSLKIEPGKILPELSARLLETCPEIKTSERLLEELEELLCRMYYDASRIELESLLSSHRSGSEVVLVKSYSEDDELHPPSIAKIGQYERINGEFNNFRCHVKNLLGGNRYPHGTEFFRTVYLGGMTYSALADYTRDFETYCCHRDFNTYYAEEPASKVIDVLRDLISMVLRPWHESSGDWGEADIDQFYDPGLRLTAERLKRVLDEFEECTCTAEGQLEITGIDGKFINPMHYVATSPLKVRAHCCTTHGDLVGRHILVDDLNKARLIDFSHTGENHALRDFAKLESAIKFELIGTTELTELCEFESSLPLVTTGKVGKFSSTRNEDLTKAFMVISEIQRLAFELVESKDEAHKEYCAALLYNALNTLGDESLPRKNRLHALMSAALICERLVGVHQLGVYSSVNETGLRQLPNRTSMKSIQKLAQRMQERKEQGMSPYVLLLGSSLSLTLAVRRAFAGAEDWEAFWKEMQGTSLTERKAALKKPLDALGLEPGYQTVARLAGAGYFNVVLTLNVDDAIDDAVRPLPADQCALLIYDGSNAAQIVAALSRATPRLKVVKLRGDINAQALPLTDTGQFEFPDSLEQSVSEWLMGDTILVGDIPYDTDVQRCIKKSAGALWCILSDEPASDSFISRAKRSRPSGEIITGADAEFNAFFTALAELLQ